MKCYRLHKCGPGTYYCPFLDLQPCIRGYHYFKPEDIYDVICFSNGIPRAGVLRDILPTNIAIEEVKRKLNDFSSKPKEDNND